MKKTLLSLALSSLVLLSFTGRAGIWDEGDPAKGENLFNGNCASCHYITEEVLAAPGLAGIKERWAEVPEELVVQWIQNPQAAHATGNPYIKGLVERYMPTYGWMPGQAVSAAEIKDILAYVQAAPPPTSVVAAGNECSTIDDDVDNTSSTGTLVWFLILLVLFVIIALAAGGVGRTLNNAMRIEQGKDPEVSQSYLQTVKAWASRNTGFVSILGLFVVAYLATIGYQALMGVGVYEGYQPEQPIKFSHAVHVCENEVDCQYCHSTAAKSKHASIPSSNVCMNCHKGIKKGPKYGEEEIGKIYAAIGFDATTGTYIDGEGNNGYKSPQESFDGDPVKWVKVHNLPDHVYFNHAQHVGVAGLICQNCHGDVAKYTVGRIAPVEEVAALKDDYPEIIALSKPTLTMGWCIECHNKAEIDLASSDYYEEIHDRLKDDVRGNEELRKYIEDGEVTVKELGGWECAKCHY